MILAGGTGEELSILTKYRAKTAIPFGGRYRIIDFALSNCVHSGIIDIAVLAQYSPKSLIDHIGMGRPWDLDRKSGGVSILQPTHHGEVAQWYLGTADALYQNIDLIRNSKADLVLVLSGDQVYLMDYHELVDFHREHGRPITVVIKAVRPSQRSRFGMIRCTRDNSVIDFREKPKSSSFRFASLGIYLFNRDFLLDALRGNKIDIVFDILIPHLANRKVKCYRFNGYWEDIGSIPSYYRASLRLLRDRSLITAPGWPIFTRGTDLPPAKFFQGSLVQNSIVADGCSVKGTVKNSVLFPGVRVEPGAVIEDSIIFSYSKVWKGTHVRRSIIDKFVDVGGKSRVGVVSRGKPEALPTAQDTGPRQRTSGITVIGKNTRISGGADIPQGLIVETHARVAGRKRR